jgi:integrase/recombinase XerD
MRIADQIPAYLRHLETLGRSPYTIRTVRFNLRDLIRFLDSEQLIEVEELTEDAMYGYQQDLAFRITHRGTLLSLRSQSKLLEVARGFCRYLHEQDYLLHDPGARLKLPKLPRRLPRSILSEADTRRLLSAPDMRTSRGYRNRVVLEILYDTAMRRLELSRLELVDLDLNTGFVYIRCGKGGKDRVVPMSERVCDLCRNYILGVRSDFIQGPDSGHLILNWHGTRMNPNGIWAVVKRCAKLADLDSHVTTHTLRHSCATHMLRAGAPIRHIQEMLGHESLDSTQIYTRVTINDLKAIHRKYHPSEHMTD